MSSASSTLTRASNRRARGMSLLQRRAAELLRRGCSQREVARMVGRSERTIRAWLHDVEGFRELAEGDPMEGPEPSALETLRLALDATRADGSPDWPIRVSAAKALIAAGELEQEPAVSVPPGGVIVYPEAIDSILGES